MTAEAHKKAIALPTLTGVFDSYSGPVLLLDEDAHLHPLNDASISVAETLNGEAGVGVMPSLVQLAVKTRSENRGKTRTFTLPDSGRQVEFLMLPQAGGTQLLIGRDATLEVNIRTALAESRTRFKDLVDVAADFAWETDADGLICYISPRGALGYSPEELLGERPGTLLLAPETAPKPLPFLAERSVRNIEVWLRTRTGDHACVLMSAMPILDKDGQRIGARGIAIDVTEERERQSELARMKIRERLVAYIVEALRNEVTPTEMLHAAATALGRSTSSDACMIEVRGTDGKSLEVAVHGTPPDPELTEEALSRVAARIEPTDGSLGRSLYLGTATGYRGAVNGAILLWRKDSAAAFDDDEVALLRAIEPQFGIVFRQIVDQHALEHLSRTDDLTGLGNRRAFMEDLSREMMRYERYGDTGALLFVDLDDFKPVNDDFGHEKGDETLRAVASILSSTTRTYDLVCRLGGDEFAVWLEGADYEIARARAENFLSKLGRWREKELGSDATLGMSIGVAMFEAGKGETVESLIANADAAMYEAKKGGKNRVFFAKGKDADE